ncbi:MAG: type 1 glutamine amidotransferase [Pseudomonadota bacterium]|nr:type 1 glutamine amidotransferase [Pseudomonadota bacterium]
MKRILIFQHVPHETLGTFDSLIEQNGCEIHYINFNQDPDSKPNIENYDGLIILGGPMCVDQTVKYPHLLTELAAIEKAIQKQIPIFGICLGAQLIAKALGANVGSNKVKEIGWYNVNPTEEGTEDLLFKHFSGAEKVFQWHGDTFDIPDNAIHLATSSDCSNQAFRYGKNVYALQFHLEVDAAIIKQWLNTSSMARELEKYDENISAIKINSDTSAYINNSINLGRNVFSSYIKLMDKRPD